MKSSHLGYKEVVHSQPKDKRVGWQSFQDIQSQIRKLLGAHSKLSSQEVRDVVELAIVLNEIGYSETARNKAWVYEIVADQNRDFIEKVIETHPEIFPTYAKFNATQQNLIKELLTFVRFDEVVELRGAYQVFEKVKKKKTINENAEFLDLAIFFYSCQLAGSAGNETYCNSPVFTRFALKNIHFLRKSFLLLKERSAEDAFQYYIGQRADWLGFDPGSSLNRLLIKVGAMMNLYTPSEGKALKEAFLKLKPEEITLLITQFDDFHAKNLMSEATQLTTFLRNLQQNKELGLSEKEKLTGSISLAFPLIVEVLQKSKGVTRSGKPIDFAYVSQIAATNPSLLKKGEVSISKDGLISIE